MKIQKHRIVIVAYIALAVMFWGGCTASSDFAGYSEQPMNGVSEKPLSSMAICDYCGNIASFTSMPERVVAASGSIGEIWINAGGNLIGVTQDAITERRLDIQDDVRILGTIKSPDLETIISLEPDYVILSADIHSHQELAITLAELDIKYGLFHIEYFEDYLALLEQFTNITDRADLYKLNGADVKTAIEHTLEGCNTAEGKTALLLRAYSSNFKAKNSDNLAGTILKDFGFKNCMDGDISNMEDLGAEEIIRLDPDYIFVTVMGSDSDAAINNLEHQLTGNPAWAKLSAVRNGRYYILPQELFHYKPNARWDEAYMYIKEILQ